MPLPLKLVLVTSFLCSTAQLAPAQGALAGNGLRPAYLVDRSAEDWSFLRDASRRSDRWDPIKYIPLRRDGTTYLTLGGEFRPFYEFYRNHNWGAGPQDDNGFYLQRFMVHADVHIAPSMRLFVELKSGVEIDRTGGPRAADEDKLDINEAFVDLYRGQRNNQPIFTLRVGRQEINYGDSGMLAIREGLNVRRAFDGAKIIIHARDWQFDFFALRPNETNTGHFDDAPDHSQTLLGAYSSSRPHFIPFLGQLEPFYVYLDRKRARFDQGVARDQRHTVGFHTINQAGGVEYEFAWYLQFGKFGAGNILAWKNVETVAYRFQSARFQPLIGLNFAVSSGDRDPNSPDLQTFHPLFPKGLYYGYIDSVGSLNAIVLHPRVNLRFARSVSFTPEAFLFWRQSTADGVYSQPGVLLRTGQLSGSRFLGSLYQAELAWNLDAHTTVALQMARFAVGDFFRETPPGKDMTYVSMKATYKF